MTDLKSLEARVANLEEIIIRLQTPTQDTPSAAKSGWVGHVYGMFQECPEFDEVLRYGREVREAERKAAEEDEG